MNTKTAIHNPRATALGRRLGRACLRTCALAITLLSTGLLHAQSLDFQTIVQWTDGTSGFKCGSPGDDGCSNPAKICASPSNISLYGDPFTGTVKCDLPPSSCTNFPFGPPNPHDFTFLVMTDVHLRNGHGITDLQHSLHPLFMKQIGHNGWRWNVSNAGFPADTIGAPIGLISTGDETDDGQHTSLGAFRLLYEAGQSTDSINLFLFPGYGNHDVQNDCQFGNCAKRMLDYSSHAAACNANGVDSESRNYSWEWGKYHMVQLNNWAGDTLAGTNNSPIPPTHDTHGSGLPWLVEDLAAHVGNSGRPVILFQHYGWDPQSFTLNDDGTFKWWSDSDRQTFLAAIKNYNVVAMITGHDHNLRSYAVPVTDSQGNQKLLDDFVGGTGGQGGYGEFFVVRLTDQFLDLMPVEWADPVVHPPTTGSPASPYPSNMTATPFFNNVQGCRKWVGAPLHSAPLSFSQNGLAVTITNNTGNPIPGPFALRYDTLSNPVPAAPGQILFTTNCAAGPLYVLGQKTGLLPGESETITLSTLPNSGVPNAVVSIGGDYFQATPNPVSLTGTDANPVHLTTAYGANVSYVIPSPPSWLKVTSDSSHTPATLTLSIDPTKAPPYPAVTLDIGTLDPAYAGLKIPVSVAPVAVTFTSPHGEQITVDDQPVTTPVTFSWTLGSVHKALAQTQSPAPGVQNRFLGWSQSGSTFQFTVTGPITYGVKFDQYVQFLAVASPLDGGTFTYNPTSPDGYYLANSKVSVTAVPNTGFVFSSFDSQLNLKNPVDIMLKNSQASLGAKFLQAGSYSVSTSLGAAGSETIDAVTLQGPQTVQWANHSTHNVSVPALVSSTAGTQYVFQQWSDGVTTASRIITAGSTPSYVAQYQQQFLVSLSVSPTVGGTVSGGGWFNANANASLTAAAANGFTFGGFSGGMVGAQSPFTFAVAQPETIVANFTPLTPALVASAGSHTNGAVTTQLTIVVNNIGLGAAVSTFLDSVTAVAQSGSGTIVALSELLPVTVLPGQSVSLPYTFTWPPTATRVAFTVHFTANNGTYSSKSTFYVVR